MIYSQPNLTCFDSQPIEDFTPEQQQHFERIRAEEKQKHQGQFTKLEKKLQDTLATAKLSQAEREHLEQSLSEVQGEVRSKEEQAKIEKDRLVEQYNKRIADLKQREKIANDRFTDATIDRALRSAANSGDSYNTEIVMAVLRPLVEMVNDKPVVNFADVNEAGDQIVVQISPAEAVKRMKQQPEKFGGLFKSNVVGGPPARNDGKIDLAKLTTEQYMRLRKERPEVLGLKRRSH